MHLRWRFAQFFELLWWRFYLFGKSPETYLHWKKAYWSAFLTRFAVEMPPGRRILDAGCGPAGIFLALADQNIDAVDPLLSRYEARLNHFSRSDYPNVRFIEQPLEDFSPDMRYDTIFCLNAINHVADLNRSLDRLTALARPEGRLYLSVDAHRYSWMQQLFRIIPGDILHPHQFTADQYAAMLLHRNWVIQRVDCIRKAAIFEYLLFTAVRPAEDLG